MTSLFKMHICVMTVCECLTVQISISSRTYMKTKKKLPL